MFKINNKMTSLWNFYCDLWTYFSLFPSDSIIDFKVLIVDWTSSFSCAVLQVVTQSIHLLKDY